MGVTGGRRWTAAVVVLLTLAGTIVAFAPAAVSAHLTLACGTDLSTPNSSYTLTGRTICGANATFGIEITANNVALNCAGLGVLDPSYSAGGTGIMVGPGVSGVSVAHCLVKGFSNGVSVSSSSVVTLKYINAYPDPNNPAVGVSFISTNASSVSHVNVYQFSTGFQVSGACNGTSFNHDFTTADLNNGFLLKSITGVAFFEDDKATANGADGFQLSNVYGTPVTDSAANSNLGDGFFVTGGAGNALISDTAMTNHANGFHLDNTTSDALNAGTSSDNLADGYFLDATVATTALSGNTARHNGQYGFDDASTGTAGAPTYSTANAYVSLNCYRHNTSGGTGGSIAGAPTQPGCF